MGEPEFTCMFDEHMAGHSHSGAREGLGVGSVANSLGSQV